MTQSRASRRVALRGVATRRVVHNFGEHARVRRTATTPIACVFGSEYTIIRRELADILVVSEVCGFVVFLLDASSNWRVPPASAGNAYARS